MSDMYNSRTIVIIQFRFITVMILITTISYKYPKLCKNHDKEDYIVQFIHILRMTYFCLAQQLQLKQKFQFNGSHARVAPHNLHTTVWVSVCLYKKLVCYKDWTHACVAARVSHMVWNTPVSPTRVTLMNK